MKDSNLVLRFFSPNFVAYFFVLTETLQAIKSSFSVEFSASNPPPLTATPKSGGGGGVSSGAAVGIAIVMMALGTAGGLLIAQVVMKRRGTGLFSYKTQE